MGLNRKFWTPAWNIARYMSEYRTPNTEPLVSTALGKNSTSHGYMPNIDDVDELLREYDSEPIGTVFVLRDGDYKGEWAILVSGKLYIFSPENVGVIFDKK